MPMEVKKKGQNHWKQTFNLEKASIEKKENGTKALI